MAKIDLDSLSIEDLADLRERANAKLTEKVAARQTELAAELEKLNQYGKPGKKAPAAAAAPATKTRKSADKGDEPKNGEAKDSVASAA